MIKQLVLLICVASLLTYCAVEEKKDADKPFVVTTTGMLYDVTKNIVGDKMTVEALMGPGVDPHLYKATQGDLAKLNSADLVIYNGIFLEGKMSEILEKLGRKKPTKAAAESIPDSLLLPSTSYEDSYDPHVWFDISLWQYAVKEASDAIIKIDTANQSFYERQTSSYLLKLDSLKSYVAARLKEIPDKQRILVTSHDAFGYFGNAYELEVKAIQGMSTVSDFGLRDIANLTDLIIENDIKAIFAETSVSEKSINALITGCRAKGHEVIIGGKLYSDAMGELGTEEGTYIGMFKYNVNAIVDALK